jgi:hypothetical protein
MKISAAKWANASRNEKKVTQKSLQQRWKQPKIIRHKK